MSKMARSGGGGHYFAHEVEAILAAFGQERHSAGSTILQGVSLRVGRITLQMGHFWAGETKRRVIKIDELENVAISLKYCEVMSGVNKIENLQAPSEYGYSEEVRLEKILLQAAEVEAEMLQVRDPRAASAMKSRLREIIFALMAHPMSDDSVVASTVERLQASMARLEELERNYTEEDAMMHRKRSMQSSYNLNERAKAFSSFAEEQAFVQEVSGLRKVQGNRVAFVVSFEALKMIPVEQWRQWNAIPTSFSDISITVAIDDPRNGFIRAEIEAKVGGRRVEMIPSGLDARATHKLLVKSPRA